jgi:RNA polymerase sigma-70 factor, ECF subfamily
VIKIAAAGDFPGMDLTAAAAPSDADGARDRLAELFERYVDFVWRTTRRFGLSAAEADDAAQHVFLIAKKKLGEIPPDRERSFLFSAAVNVSRTMIRSKVRRREEALDEIDAAGAGPDPEQLLERRRAMDTVYRSLEAMPDDLRVAFVLFELEEMTAIEVAQLLGIPSGTVASRVRRARDVFRNALNAAEGR